MRINNLNNDNKPEKATNKWKLAVIKIFPNFKAFSKPAK